MQVLGWNASAEIAVAFWDWLGIVLKRSRGRERGFGCSRSGDVESPLEQVG